MKLKVPAASLLLASSSVTFWMSESSAFVIDCRSSPSSRWMEMGTKSRGATTTARFAVATEIATIFEGEPTARAKVLCHREILGTSPVYSPTGEAVSLNDLLPSDDSAASIVVFLRSLG